MKLELPWPPSVNNYWRPFRGRMVVTGKGKEYEQSVFRYVFKHGLDVVMKERLFVEITLQAPTRRKYDIDNFNKCLLDSLTRARVWDDDSQIDVLHIKRGAIIKDGAVIVTITRL